MNRDISAQTRFFDVSRESAMSNQWSYQNHQDYQSGRWNYQAMTTWDQVDPNSQQMRMNMNTHYPTVPTHQQYQPTQHHSTPPTTYIPQPPPGPPGQLHPHPQTQQQQHHQPSRTTHTTHRALPYTLQRPVIQPPPANTVHPFPPQPPQINKAPTPTPMAPTPGNTQTTPTHTPKQPQTPTTQQSKASQATPTPTSGTPQTQHTVPHHVQTSDKWTPNTECYDSCTNLGGPVYRQIQATAWSRRKGIQGQDPLTIPFAALTRYGVEDYSIRLLSQGKFTGVVATRSVAESVFLSQMVKALRDHNIDLDIAAEASHKGTIPSKTSDPIRFFEPLIQSVLDDIKSKVPPETSLDQIHKLADTEAQLAKAHQKLQQHGIQVTPQRQNTSRPAAPALPTQTSTPEEQDTQADIPADSTPDDQQPPHKKPRRAKSKADKTEQADKTDMATILNPSSMTLQDNHPTSHTDTKVTQWLDNIKDKKLHTYVKKITNMLTSLSKKDRPNLVETAIRYGVPMDKVQSMSYKSLAQVVAAGAYFAI